MYVEADGNPLQLLSACLPNLASLTVKYWETGDGLEDISKLPHLIHIVIRLEFTNRT